ncbi:MAG TPA: DsrE family protein [Candidatus Methanofastidiosa archaeon]|nr:DsrE family protein [Candidatus Methanofastidiosa archaeon]HPR41679.1 DsrE family protein [Candidatus Methanofastidiosa archaeon]
MVNLVVEITHPPYGHENTFAGLYVALTSLAKGMNVTVIFHGDGAYTSLRGQSPEKKINVLSTERQIEDILALGGRVIAYRDALVHRGILKEEMIEGIEILDSPEIYDLMLENTDKVIVF